MADVEVTNREVISRGAFRTEIGQWTNQGSVTYEIRTMLENVVAFRFQGLTGSDNDVAKYLNFSDAGTTRDPGSVHVRAFVGSDQLTAGGVYIYEAIGF